MTPHVVLQRSGQLEHGPELPRFRMRCSQVLNKKRSTRQNNGNDDVNNKENDDVNNKHSTDISPVMPPSTSHDLHVAHQGIDQPRDVLLVKTKLRTTATPMSQGLRAQRGILLRPKHARLQGDGSGWRWGAPSGNRRTISRAPSSEHSRATLALDCAASTRRVQRCLLRTDATETTRRSA